MNKKAEELELKNTHFVTPHGLDETKHYTSAYELAKITDYALNIKKFAQIVNTKTTTININLTPMQLHNTNELLGNLEGVNGVKTGFTNNAGRCLVTSTTRNGHQIICVVLGADTKKIRTTDSVKLIEYAFSNYEYVNIKNKVEEEFNVWQQENLNNITIIKGTKQSMELILGNQTYIEMPVKKDNVKDIEIKINCNITQYAPVEKNKVIGNIEVCINNETVENVEILAKEKITKKDILYYMKELITNYNQHLQTALAR